MHHDILGVLLVVTIVSGITDILKGKIYNIITLPAISSGLIINFYHNGLRGLQNSFLGILIVFIIFILLFLTGGIAAGDVKLLMAIGSLVGVNLIFNFIFFSLIIGGIMANIVMIRNKVFFKSWKNIGRFFFSLIPGFHFKIEYLKKENSITIPFGYAISLGSLVYLLINGF